MGAREARDRTATPRFTLTSVTSVRLAPHPPNFLDGSAVWTATGLENRHGDRKVGVSTTHPSAKFMKPSRSKKDALLGMPLGTASARLRKEIMFEMVCALGRDTCHRCHKKITVAAQLSIDHKDAWMSAAEPVKTFFALDNIAFSHLSCNVAAGTRRGPFKHITDEQKRAAKKKWRVNSDRTYNAKRKAIRDREKLMRP